MGVKFPAGGWGFASKPEKPQKLCRPYRDFRSSDVDQGTNLHTTDIASPPISFWEKSDEGVSKKWGIKNWGVGHFWGLPPSGARSPHLILAAYSRGNREKNGFYLGGMGPHLGEIWGFEILRFWRTLAYFCSELCRQILDFLTAFDS